jgi:aspartyl-tRNA(Asn)/glutamyl-tRNA(Gln) amidotransferase subunit A
VLPTVLNVAPAIADLADDRDYFRLNAMSLRNTSVGNFLNGCAISIPMHRADEPPTGFMLLAPWGHDQPLLAAARTVEGVFSTALR